MAQRLLVILPTNGHGGCEYNALSFARYAQEVLGLAVIVAMPDVEETGFLFALATRAELSIARLPLSFEADDDAARVAAQSKLIDRLIDETRPDVAFVPLPWPVRGLGLVAGLAGAGVPALVKFALVPDQLYVPAPDALSLAARAKQRRQTWFANSAASAALVERHFGLAPGSVDHFHVGPIGLTHLLPAGETGSDLGRPAARSSVEAEFGLEPGSLLAVTVGRLAWQKGHETLIEAMERAGRDLPALHFLWVGDGEERDALTAALSARGLSDRVALVGFRPDVRRLLRAADLFILPTRYEGGSSQALLEAMEEGLPSIVSRLPGVADVAEDGIHALLVPPDDPDALADALRRLTADGGMRRRLGEAARARSRAFGAEAMFDATAKRLLPLLAAPLAPPIHSKYEKFTRVIEKIWRLFAVHR